jgi:molybdopterin synthase catalytic subunit
MNSSTPPRTHVAIVDGPVVPAMSEPLPGSGGLLVFEGFVREIEPREGDSGARIEALHYQSYEPMAQTQIARIGDDLIERHGLLGLTVVHSRGRVRVGECSIRVVVSSRHRKEALAAMDQFIDRLKQDVPIWKEPVWR